MKERGILALAAAALILALPIISTGCLGLASNTTESATQVRTAMPAGAEADAASIHPAVSADGRFVAFESGASNLVLGAANGSASIYMKNLETGATMLVSSSQDGVQGKGDSDMPTISRDGRFVAFVSSATNLAPGITQSNSRSNCTSQTGLSVSCPEIFVKDTQSGSVTLASADSKGVQADSSSGHPSISGDGRYVAFASAATNLGSSAAASAGSSTAANAGSSPGAAVFQVYLKDTQTGATSLLSQTASGQAADRDCSNPVISTDGSHVAFSTAAALTPEDTNDKPDVYSFDLRTGALARVSVASSGGQANDASGFYAIALSADGRFVAFDSAANDLTEDDTNQKRDVFLKDTQTGAIQIVSMTAGGQPGGEDSYASISMSADAGYVAFSSDAPDLASGDANGKRDVFIRNMTSGQVILVSLDAAGRQGNGKSDDISVSADGQVAAFDSDANNLVPGDTKSKTDIFVRDFRTGTVTRASITSSDQ